MEGKYFVAKDFILWMTAYNGIPETIELNLEGETQPNEFTFTEDEY